jgi:hypothetical protein
MLGARRALRPDDDWRDDIGAGKGAFYYCEAAERRQCLAVGVSLR